MPEVTREPWMEQANCRGCDPELFFPERGDSKGLAVTAKAVCRACVVRDECLDYALRNNERDGIWGGYSGRDRPRMRRERGIVVARPVRREHGTNAGYEQHRRHGDEPCAACREAKGRYMEAFRASRAVAT